MLSFNRFISIIGIAIFIVASNAGAMEDLRDVEDYGGTWEIPFFSLNDLKTFVGDKINRMGENIQGLYEVINGDAFDFDIVMDEQGLELLHYKLIEKHQAPLAPCQ